MIKKVKAAIQDRIYQNCISEYQNALQCQSDPYLAWIRETEMIPEKEGVEESYPSLSVVYMEQCAESFQLSDVKQEIVVFVSKEGKISVCAFKEIVKYFEKHQDIDIVYADEDIWMLPEGGDEEPDNEITHRMSPWMKPMWSPDTLFSFQYFGNIFAIRKSAFLDLKWLAQEDWRHNLYDFVLQATAQGKRAGHIEKILFHAYRKGKDKAAVEQEVMLERKLWGADSDYDYIRELALDRRNLKATLVKDEKTGYSYPLYRIDGNPLVSIIIPSKDNVDVLRQCIRSIYHKTEYKNFEIIVIDNGSTAQARMTLESFREECPFTYLYQPMEFNFSKMCNIGLKKAQGEYVLLLNDDMEVIEESWLTRMLGQATLSHVGAVGAKLFYPNTTLIQHAGITNTCDGPGHKLRKMDDTQVYYYGRNKLIYDMIGVTAACLLMKKSLLESMGGLYEGLKVAYNDVDLCFRIIQKGLYIVQRNDVILYHHESLSRGDDLQDKAKIARLLAEKDVLFERHPNLYRPDPVVGWVMNSGEPEYDCRWIDGYELADIIGYEDKVTESKPLPNMKRVNQAIMITMEECGKAEYQRTGAKGKGYYMLKGWAFVPGADNARYEMKLLLRNPKGKVWEIPVAKRYRKDVAAIMEDQINVEMTGFCCWIYEGTLPSDTYEIWMTAKDACSRQRLYRSSETSLVIE